MQGRDKVMLHHIVFGKVGTPDATCGGGAERFYAEGEERLAFDLPNGYGYPNKGTDRWYLLYMLMNHKPKALDGYVRYTVRVRDGRGTRSREADLARRPKLQGPRSLVRRAGHRRSGSPPRSSPRPGSRLSAAGSSRAAATFTAAGSASTSSTRRAARSSSARSRPGVARFRSRSSTSRARRRCRSSSPPRGSPSRPANASR